MRDRHDRRRFALAARSIRELGDVQECSNEYATSSHESRRRKTRPSTRAAERHGGNRGSGVVDQMARAERGLPAPGTSLEPSSPRCMIGVQQSPHPNGTRAVLYPSSAVPPRTFELESLGPTLKTTASQRLRFDTKPSRSTISHQVRRPLLTRLYTQLGEKTQFDNKFGYSSDDSDLNRFAAAAAAPAASVSASTLRPSRPTWWKRGGSVSTRSALSRRAAAPVTSTSGSSAHVSLSSRGAAPRSTKDVDDETEDPEEDKDEDSPGLDDESPKFKGEINLTANLDDLAEQDPRNLFRLHPLATFHLDHLVPQLSDSPGSNVTFSPTSSEATPSTFHDSVLSVPYTSLPPPPQTPPTPLRPVSAFRARTERVDERVNHSQSCPPPPPDHRYANSPHHKPSPSGQESPSSSPSAPTLNRYPSPTSLRQSFSGFYRAAIEFASGAGARFDRHRRAAACSGLLPSDGVKLGFSKGDNPFVVRRSDTMPDSIAIPSPLQPPTQSHGPSHGRRGSLQPGGSMPGSLSTSPSSLYSRSRLEDGFSVASKRKSYSDLHPNPSSGLASSLKASMGPLAGIGVPQVAITEATRQEGPDLVSKPAREGSQVVAPTNSILLNPIRRQSQSVSSTQQPVLGEPALSSPSPLPSSPGPTGAGGSPAQQQPLPPAPVVTHIPAVPSEKEIQRVKERKEREKAKEKEERERREREAREAELAQEIQTKEEKVWGIPKKAFYLGLGSVPGALNFNAHMAMMAGWGNGSGGPSDFNPPPLRRSATSTSRSSVGKTRGSGSAGKRSQPVKSNALKRSSSHSRSVSADVTPRTRETATDEDDNEQPPPLEPEELAALNAIINTRRSMAAAQALANGEVKLPAPKRPVRPSHSAVRHPSQESVPTQTSESSAPGEGSRRSQSVEGSLPPLLSKDSSGSVQTMDTGEDAGCKIRFAPLPKHSPIDESPFETGTDQALREGDDFLAGQAAEEDGHGWKSFDFFGKRRASRDGYDSESIMDDSDAESDLMDSDADGDEFDAERWKRQMSQAKGKWYLMGLPPAAFKNEYYRAWKRWSQEAMATGALSSAKPGSLDAQGRQLASKRRSSTDGVSAFVESEKKVLDPSGELAAPSTTSLTSTEKEGGPSQRPRSKRGRRTKRSASRPASARSASLSGDEEERSRRRQLIRSIRPGGTGMVTLPDGTRVKARRVGDGETDGEDLPWEDWGFAGLARGKKIVPDPVEGPTPAADSLDAVDDTVPHSPPKASSDPDTSSEASRARTEQAEAAVAGPPLSAQRAAEVRRRHEAEMAALGAEVLAAHRRKVEQATNPSSTPPTSMDSTSNAHPEPSQDNTPKFPGLSRLPSRDSSKHGTSPTRLHSSFKTSMTGTVRQSQTSLNSFRRRSSSEQRIKDPALAFYSPDTSLPRKPDAKGYAVVPLPSELGLRPSRPREGRVWEMSDDDDSSLVDERIDDSSSAELGGDATSPRSKPEQDLDDDDEDLDEAEIAEEEQRKAVHSKRATTSAAGRERMHVRSRSGNVASLEGRSKAIRRTHTVDEGRPKRVLSADATMAQGHESIAASMTRRRGASLSETQGELSRLVLDGTAVHMSSPPPPPLQASPTSTLKSDSAHQLSASQSRKQSLLRSAKSSPTIPRSHRRKPKGKAGGRASAALDDEEEDDDDLELWPSSAASVIGFGSPGKRPSSAILLAQTSKARALRERRERQQRDAQLALKLKQEKDDDALDYGWPPTLKGSLYDR